MKQVIKQSPWMIAFFSCLAVLFAGFVVASVRTAIQIPVINTTLKSHARAINALEGQNNYTEIKKIGIRLDHHKEILINIRQEIKNLK